MVGLARGSPCCVVCRSPVIASVAVPWVTDPVMPGEVVGTALPLALIVVPVPPVAEVGEAAGGTDAVADGLSDDPNFPPHATASDPNTSAIASVCFLRTWSPFPDG